jgi:hypothetical protein
MLAANFDITLDRASDYSFVLTIQNQAGLPVDITGAVFYSDIREKASKNEILDLSPTILSAISGQVTIALTKAQTKTLRSGRGIYEWDLFMDLNSKRTRLLYGALTARAQITNDV